MKYIKLLENFSRDYLQSNSGSLTKAYAEKLTDFSLEESLIEELDSYERQLESLFSDNWSLNRGSRFGTNGDYFALNVKVYSSPDIDEVESEVGLELDDEGLSDIWYSWLQEQAEMFEEDIKESYDWVDNVSWGGNSGGWIHIHPDKGADSLLEYAAETIHDYLDTKEEFDAETIKEVADAINSPKWKRLAELGLVEDEDAVLDITTKLKESILWFETESNTLVEIERDLTSIQGQHREFNQNAKKYFLDFLKEEVADGHIN